MNKLELNETPVRTSRNFKINNIELENIEIPEKLRKFNSVVIYKENEKKFNKIDKLENFSDLDFNISDSVSKIDLKYGLDKFLTNQVENDSNFISKIEVKSTENKKLKYVFNCNDNNRNLAENIEIKANEGTSATLIFEYNSVDLDSTEIDIKDSKSEKNIEEQKNQIIKNYHNGIIRTKACKNSVINIILVNFLNEKSNNFLTIQNEFEDNAKINFYIIDFGGKNSITNYYSNISGENADNQLNTIYLGKNKQLFDLNYIGELYGKKSNIDIEVQGALKDDSKKHFKGTIDFKKGCKKATGNENENCMLLSDKSKSIALPMLLCSEEDVEGNHSSSAGKVGEKELFYIMSRGFELKEAMKLIVRAKFNKILEKIEDDELKNKILEEINQRLD